ncbi:hypothetical protein ASE57_05150 [Sphingomonas sp. Leaf11]|nr:hypothetical protein ASE58_05155 [Sphingomonas sp. Leaf9]KQM44081.1 hypothetical protein ASE57_05150 [Sphingomonas sp. Leaf11]
MPAPAHRRLLAQPHDTAAQPNRQHPRKAGRAAGIARFARENLVQPPARQATAQRGVDIAMPGRHPHRLAHRRTPLHGGDLPLQRGQGGRL